MQDLDLDGIIRELENYLPKTIQIFSKKIKPAIDNAAEMAIANYYTDYVGEYDRTYNFINNRNVTTTADDTGVTINVTGDKMWDYPGFWGDPLDGLSAFEMFYMNGEHGHGKFLAATTTPPDEYMKQSINSGLNGQINRLLKSSVKEVLGF